MNKEDDHLLARFKQLKWAFVRFPIRIRQLSESIDSNIPTILSKRSSRESTNNQIPVLHAQNAWSRVRKKVHEPKFRMAVKTTAADHLNNAMSIQLVPIYDYRNIHVYAYYV